MKALDTHSMMEGFLLSAALNTALEKGLFWLLAERPRTSAEVSRLLQIPLNRCESWLAMLEDWDLIEQQEEAFAPSSYARTSILETWSRETWALLAEETMDMYLLGNHLADLIQCAGSVLTAQGLRQYNYVTRMAEDAGRARRFTRALFEIHQKSARELAEVLDVRQAQRMLDLGGGSGVYSQALVRSNPGLRSIVVDLPTVCAAGRAIVAEQGLEKQICFLPADLLKDTLPGGFELVLEYDVGVYDRDLFRKVRNALNPGGCFAVADRFLLSDQKPYKNWRAFAYTLLDPDYRETPLSDIEGLLVETGFSLLSSRLLPDGRILVQAARQDAAN